MGNGMKDIKSILKQPKTPAKRRRTVRGDLVLFLAKKMSRTYPRAAKMLQGLTLLDLRATKSMFEDRERTGGIERAKKWFFWSLKPPTKII